MTLAIVSGSSPPIIDPVRYSLVFEPDREYPGTVDQQHAIRWRLDEITPRAVALCRLFVQRYKWASVRKVVKVQVRGGLSFAGSTSITCGELEAGDDLALTFIHEWGHVFDEWMLNSEKRQWLMTQAGVTDGDWKSYDKDYFERPAEWFAWSFQRLIWPLPLVEHRFHTADMWRVCEDVRGLAPFDDPSTSAYVPPVVV